MVYAIVQWKWQGRVAYFGMAKPSSAAVSAAVRVAAQETEAQRAPAWALAAWAWAASALATAQVSAWQWAWEGIGVSSGHFLPTQGGRLCVSAQRNHPQAG